MRKINLYWYRNFLPRGLLTLLHKRKNVNFKDFIELTENYMSEEEKAFLFKKIYKEEGIDLNKFKTKKKDVPLFKSVSSEKDESASENKNIIIVFSTTTEKKKQFPENKKIKNIEPNMKELDKNMPEKTKENRTNNAPLKVMNIENKNF